MVDAHVFIHLKPQEADGSDASKCGGLRTATTRCDTPSDTETSCSSVQLLIAIASSTWNQSVRLTYAAARFLQNSPDGNLFVDSVSHCSQIRQDKNGLSADELDPPLRTRSSRSKPGDRGSRVRKVRWVVDRHGVTGVFMRFPISA